MTSYKRLRTKRINVWLHEKELESVQSKNMENPKPLSGSGGQPIFGLFCIIISLLIGVINIGEDTMPSGCSTGGAIVDKGVGLGVGGGRGGGVGEGGG